MADVAGTGAAMRRRQRRQRSWWRHEQLSIAAAMATVSHHSFQVGTKNDAPRGQKTVSSAGGMRRAPLSEFAGPQGVAVTVGDVVAGAPLLVVPTLHGNDGVDGTTVSFLLAQNLRLQKEEEEVLDRRSKDGV